MNRKDDDLIFPQIAKLLASYFKYNKSCMFPFWNLVAGAAAGVPLQNPAASCCLRFRAAAGCRCKSAVCALKFPASGVLMPLRRCQVLLSESCLGATAGCCSQSAASAGFGVWPLCRCRVPLQGGGVGVLRAIKICAAHYTFFLSGVYAGVIVGMISFEQLLWPKQFHGLMTQHHTSSHNVSCLCSPAPFSCPGHVSFSWNIPEGPNLPKPTG